MKSYARARRGGKTHELMIKHFLRHSSILLVHSNQEKNRLIKQYKLNSQDADRILPWHHAKDALKGIGRRTLLIDNVDRFLATMFNNEIEATTFTGTCK